MGVHRCTRCVPPPPFFVLVLSSFRVPTSAALWTARGARHASPEDPPKREVVVKQIRNDITEVGSEIRAVFNSSISKAVADDFDRFGYIWMGGWRVRWPVLIVELSELFICLAWLVYYAVFLHKDENPQILRDWHARVDHHDYVGSPLRGCANINREDSAELEPDLVLVFHHPDAAHPDDLQDMSLEDVIHVIHPSLRLDHKSASIPLDAVLSRMLSTLGVQASELWSDQGDAETDRWKQILSRSVRQPRRQLRTCFLQDVVQLLSENMHFHTEAFRSESGTGLHVAVSLRSPEVTRHYIAKNDMYLQIRQDVIKELGVHQPRDEFASSPPYIPYDTKVVRELFAAGRLPSEDEHKLYKKVGPMSSRNRFRVIHNELSGLVDLDAAKEARLILDWYPSHESAKLDRLFDVWGDWRNLGMAQPLPWIREYFGSRVAFQFAWNGLYTRGLLALIPAALLFELVDMRQLHGHKRTMPVFGPALVIIVWSTVLREVWDQEQHFFTTFWSLDTERMRRAMRPQFRGSRRPAHYDNSMFELHWPHGRTSSYAFRRFVSKVVMFAFCCMVAPSIAWWYHTFSHDMNMVASLILSVQIAVLDKVCAYVVRGLTDWENHKFQDAYFDSFISKMFLFQCVNHYLPFIYLGVRQEFLMHGNCGEEVCLSVLRKQLCLRQCICLLDCIFAFLDSVAHVEWQLRWRRVKLPLLEAQSYFGEYRTLQQYRHTMRLLIPLGSSLIFGAVAPIMVIINFLVFAVELRCQAYLLTTYYKRPVPRIMQGIGEMKHIVERLTFPGPPRFIGTLTSSTLVVLFGDLFKDSHNQAKVAGWCTFYCLAIAIQGAVEWAIKGESEDLPGG
ncbi:unnamed protein product [Prorocentrum cordatum]|uniref:Anoctamin transmembrane domain-containing protein n=1 Tax=Prorocentrum cordatum TaxID=2364126 RepID=A0ABN9T1Y0_9DINO|nr:unnamed protein product [Polarella glacialis]